MSIQKIVLPKIVGSAMSANQALPKINSTTLSVANTSIPDIRNNAQVSAYEAMGSGADTIFYSPLDQMNARAVEIYTLPGESSVVANAYAQSKSYADAQVAGSLPGANNSLFDIQNTVVQSAADSIANFGSALSSLPNAPRQVAGVFITPVQEVMKAGNASLSTFKSLSDNVIGKGYSASKSSVEGAVNSINGSVVDKIQAENSKALDAKRAAELESGEVAKAGDAGAANPADSQGSSYSGSEDPPESKANTTDVVYQDVSVFIEGVQVPFEAISISQSIGNYPTAQIQIPPQNSLMDIARYYQPKVHIFYKDKNYGGDRLLFWGHIAAPNYSRSRQQGMATIGFSCVHRNATLDNLTLDYAGYIPNNVLMNVNPEESAVKVTTLNSHLSIIIALQGISGIQTEAVDKISIENEKLADAKTHKLDPRFTKFEKRFKGMPGAIMNFWNQTKQSTYLNPSFAKAMTLLYIPLVEEGLAYFDRMSGHPFLEDKIDAARQEFCPGGTSPKEVSEPVLIPPSYLMNSFSAIQSALATDAIQSIMGYSGERTSFTQLVQSFLNSVEYESITLASPAEIAIDPSTYLNPDEPDSWGGTEKMAVETIIKPQIPFYYSPVCNVILPKMFHTISVAQAENEVPTRITAFNSQMISAVGGNKLASSYRAPESVREATSLGSSEDNSGIGSDPAVSGLLGTTGNSFGIPGKYEQGRGIQNFSIQLPDWLARFSQGQKEDQANTAAEGFLPRDTEEYKALVDLHAAWVYRNGYDTQMVNDEIKRTRNTDRDVMDPNFISAGIHPYQRLLFSSADYEFTKAVVRSRVGSVEALFNPYIIPGYPMEIIDDSPNSPCFHAMCSSVTHSITARSIGTSIAFIGASTYTEMSNYYLQPLHPWLTTALEMVDVKIKAKDDKNSASSSEAVPANNEPRDSNDPKSPKDPNATKEGESSGTETKEEEYGQPKGEVESVNSTIVNNVKAKEAADKFYMNVLGVPAAAIEDVYDFQYGQVIPVTRFAGKFTMGSNDPMPSDNGGDMNPFRTAMGNLRMVCRPIEGMKSITAKFGLQFIKLTPSNYNGTVMSYMNPHLVDEKYLVEPGASMFLDYQDTKEFLKDPGGAKAAELAAAASASQADTVPDDAPAGQARAGEYEL